MVKKVISLGVVPDGVGGDTYRTAMQKAIDNFDELYDSKTITESGFNSRGRWVKWADGTMLITFNMWTTAVIPANSNVGIEYDSPTAGLGNAESGVFMSAIPTNSNDHFGVISSQVISPTKIQFVIRNGPVSQAFSMRCNVWTRWR